MSTSRQSRVSPTVLPSAMIALSALWFMSAWVFHVTNRNSKDGVIGVPVWALAVLILIPFTTLAILTPCLLRARWEGEERLRFFDYFGLVVGLSPFAFVLVVVLINLGRG